MPTWTGFHDLLKLQSQDVQTIAHLALCLRDLKHSTVHEYSKCGSWNIISVHNVIFCLSFLFLFFLLPSSFFGGGEVFYLFSIEILVISEILPFLTSTNLFWNFSLNQGRRKAV